MYRKHPRSRKYFCNISYGTQFYTWFKFYFCLFLGMVMYNNELQTKGNIIKTKDKIEPEDIHNTLFAETPRFLQLSLTDFCETLHIRRQAP